MTRGLVLGLLIATGALSMAGAAQAPQAGLSAAAVAATKIEKVKDNLYIITGSGTANRDAFSGGNTAVFITAAGDLQDSRLALLALGAAAYSVLRFIEAFGLLRGRAWAEVLAAGSGAVYVPFELAGFVHHPTLLRATLLVANAVVVLVMVSAFLQRQKPATQNAALTLPSLAPTNAPSRGDHVILVAADRDQCH